MKQYKHKKTGEIWTEQEDLGLFYYSNTKTLPKNYVENSNDWEEITKPECKCGVFDCCDKSSGCKRGLHKPEYTILSFQDISSKQIYNKGKEDSWYHLYDNTVGFSLISMMELGQKNVRNGKFIIHSVRRESDGKVFTVGDDTNIGIIKSFEVCKGEHQGVLLANCTINMRLTDITKVKPKEWKLLLLGEEYFIHYLDLL